MTTLGSPVYAGSSNLPLWVSTSATSITITDATQSGSAVLTESNSQLLVNGTPVGGSSTPSNWSLYSAISNTVKMDSSNFITNVSNNLYFAGNLLARYSDIPALSNWSLYSAISNTIKMDASNNITNTGSNLYFAGNQLANTSIISNWSLYPAISNTIRMDASNNLSNSGSNLYFAGNLLSTGGGTPSNWSSYAASSVVNISNYTMSNVSNILGLNNINISNSGGSNVVNTADLNITTGNGNRGKLTLTANPGFSNGVQGELRLVANGGSFSTGGISYATGGLVEITANTPVATSNTFTGAVKINAASCLMYSGPVAPIGSLLGYTYIQGYLGNSMIAGSYSTIPNTPGTNYLYGSSGTKIENGLYTDTIRNISSFGNLEISTVLYPSFVNVSNIGNLTGMAEPITSNGLGIMSNMSNIYTSNVIMTTTFDGLGTGNISNINTIRMSNITGIGSNGVMNGMSNITTSNINVGTINGSAYPVSPSNWAGFPALTNVDMSNFGILNLSTINSNDLYVQCVGDLTDSYSLIAETPYVIEWNNQYTNQMLISNTSIFNRVNNANLQIFQVNVSLNVRSDNTSPVNFYVYSTYDGGPNQAKHYTLEPSTTNTYVYSIYTALGYNRPFEIVTICDNSNVQLLNESGVTLGSTSLPDVPAATLFMYNVSSYNIH
jgi:hypothetical protein